MEKPAGGTDHEAVLRKQLQWNSETWAALNERGVTEKTPVALDFFFNAPSESAATELAKYLRAETDYSVEVTSMGDGPRKEWSVEGTTKPQPVSPAVLDQWVTWMVQAGAQHGDCEFDGWGALV